MKTPGRWIVRVVDVAIPAAGRVSVELASTTHGKPLASASVEVPAGSTVSLAVAFIPYRPTVRSGLIEGLGSTTRVVAFHMDDAAQASDAARDIRVTGDAPPRSTVARHIARPVRAKAGTPVVAHRWTWSGEGDATETWELVVRFAP
jgi:hypothetical protein